MIPTICVYGNLVRDNIYFLNGYPKENSNNNCTNTIKQLGGIINFVRQLNYLKDLHKKKINIHIKTKINKNEINQNHYNFLNPSSLFLDKSDLPTSNSSIWINTKTGSRTSAVQWGACTELDNFDVPENCWLHLMYLDKLPNLNSKILESIKRKNVVISADLCQSDHSEKEKKRINDMFPYIDYMFMSNQEEKELNTKTNNTLFIIHSPKECKLIQQSHSQIIINKYFNKNIKNTLGAGDTFAATFVFLRALHSCYNNTNTIKYAQLNTWEYLTKE